MAKVKGLLADIEETPEFQAGWQAYEDGKESQPMTIEQLRLWHKGFESARDHDLSP